MNVLIRQEGIRSKQGPSTGITQSRRRLIPKPGAGWGTQLYLIEQGDNVVLIKIKTKKELGGQLPEPWIKEMEYLYGRTVAAIKIKSPLEEIRYETTQEKTGNCWSILKREIKYTINPTSKKVKKTIEKQQKTREETERLWKACLEKK